MEWLTKYIGHGLILELVFPRPQPKGSRAFLFGVPRMIQPFRPSPAATVNIDVSSSSQAVKIADGVGIVHVRVMNNGSATAWITFGSSTVTAVATSSVPVASGGTEVFSFANNDGSALYVAAIAAASTGKIYFTPGVGV